ncbi:replication-associated recombination protein A [Patescibacteria group bacterium]|nr:replication-associated recombination protein A [Patescibacteria group bacterium]MDE1940601.1 replication-associated recombination protein A [Patescibacteria group bacterium]
MEPLANKIRPKSLKEFVGQEHLVGAGKPLRKAIEDKHLFSYLLWGPPGTGKTTIARIYAQAVNARIYELSAVSAGKDDIRKIVEEPDTLLEGRPKVLFLDEIHRFNKAQQDYLLPFVESGKLTLIGATTENPSFEVIPALLSRCRVFVLKSLNEAELKTIIKRTKIKMPKDAIDWLAALANGDARIAITAVENCQRLYGTITLENLKNTFEHAFIRFDKKGEEHYDTISAFIKSMRAGDADAALYYLARMIEGGEDPKFIARRMVVFASEDIGLAQPTALVVANEVFRAVEEIGLPEAQINLAHGTAYLALAAKDRSAYSAYFEALDDVKKTGNLPIPLKIRNAPTKLMKELGYHEGYEKYPKSPGSKEDSYLPEKLKGKRYLKRKGKP